MSEPNTVQPSISDQARDWVLRLASGEMDASEIDRFRIWIAQDDAHAQAFEQRRSLWQTLGAHPELFAQPVLPPLRPRHALRRMTARPRRVAMAASALAASLLAIMAAPEILLWIEADHRTAAQVAAYRLPDGSTAWLDAGSAISVDFDAQERRIRLLRGNAFFTVKHGEPRPFRVAALQGVVEDIGTSFEVRQQNAYVAVAVTQGAVRVASDKSKSVILREGQSAGYDAAGALTPSSASTPDSIAPWRHRELMIDRQSSSGVIREIARYRRGPTWIWADLDEGARRPVNGALRIDDADAALSDFAAAQGLKVTMLPGGIAIVRNGDQRAR